MASNVEQSNEGSENLFKSAKQLYSESNKNGEDVNVNANDTSEGSEKVFSQNRDASVAVASSVAAPSKYLDENNRKSFQESKVNDQTPVFSKLRNFITRSKSKDVKDILTPENANPEIRSETGNLSGVREFCNLAEGCRPEVCNNYTSSNTLNPDKLTEIINNSIKAAVENLSNDINPPYWSQEKKQESIAPFESPCFNDTCPQRKKTTSDKENVTSSTQYSQQAVSSSIKPNNSTNICSIYENNNSSRRNSKWSCDSHRRSSSRQSPTRCVPLSNSGANSVICHRSVSTYKQTICPCVKQKPDKPSKLCKPCKPCKPCKLLKTDNRRMTGNVNIYICSEGNDGGNEKKKKSESTYNSMTATNASCTCSSTDVCTCQSSTSSKTIRNLMSKTNNKNKIEDITLKCACGKLPSDCECLPVQSTNLDNEALCLCEMSSLNPTTSVETCRDTMNYNRQTPKTSDPLPHGDYCVNKVRSRSSSRYEPCYTRQNFDTLDTASGVENDSVNYVGKSKFTTCNSGRGDTIQECSCCDTFSNYSEGKLNVCNCCEANVANTPSLNQPERYVIQNIVNYGTRREDEACNCYKHDDESVYSSRKKSGEVDQSVCCQNKKIDEPRVQPQKKDYCKKACSPSRSTAHDDSSPRRWRYSDSCIMEENEECDANCCKFFTPKQQDLKTGSSFQKASWAPCRRESNVSGDKSNVSEERRSFEANGKRDNNYRKSFTSKQQDLKMESSSRKASSTPYRQESNTSEERTDINGERRSIEVNGKSDDSKITAENSRSASQRVSTRMSVAGKRDDAEIATDNSRSASQRVATRMSVAGKSDDAEIATDNSRSASQKISTRMSVAGKRDDARIATDKSRSVAQSTATKMSVAEAVKSLSNADKSTSSHYFSFASSSPPLLSVSKTKESRKSSLKWPFSKAKSLISGKSTSAESKTNKSPTNSSKSQANVASVELVKSDVVSNEIVTEKIANGSNSETVSKSIAGEKSSSMGKKSSSEGGALLTIKSSDNGEEESKELIIENNKTKLSSSKLGSLIADRKNSFQSATNETARSYEDDQSNGTCQCGAMDADMCTCQYPYCTCCNRPQEYCKCNEAKDRIEKQPSNVSKQTKQVCYCSEASNEQKSYHTLPKNDAFRVCTLCCRPEKNCGCNLSGQSPRRSRTPSNLCNKKNTDSYESVGRKSQICIYCERPREKCACRAPVKKCSYCGMPADVCNCQDVETSCNVCSYDENTCQCNGRVIGNPDGGDQSICVTAWKPRREIRKYFSRNPGERDSPDCPCCETVRPYGSDELPYQRLSVFSDVMTELQQKMNELPSCNRCEKIPCCCYVQEPKSYSSPVNESRPYNAKQRKPRSRSPPCRHCPGSNPCKCGGQKSSSYQICDRCRTTPCRCRKSRSTQRKPPAKCYYCKCSPCRCESNNKTTTPKGCRSSRSPPRTQEQATPLIPDKNPERNPPSSRSRSCRCRCGSPNCGSPSRGQERRCG